MNNKLFDSPVLRHDSYEIVYIFILIQVVNPKSAFDSDGYLNPLTHRLCDFSHLFWLIHKQCTETPLYSLSGRAPAVHINLVIPVLLCYFRCLSHFIRVVAAQLTHDWMLSRVESHQLVSLLGKEDGVFIQHLGVNIHMLG
jgi:hypothetical protein